MTGIVEPVASAVLVVLAASLLLSTIRLIRGPTLPDRVVALDLIAVIVVGMVSVHAIVSDEPVILRAAVVLALIAFLGTVAFAFYVSRGGRDA